MVDHSLAYIRQSTNNTCWAASTAMMVRKSSDMEVVEEMKQKYPDSVWDDGATQLELREVASAYGLNQVYPVCQGADGWEQWLSNSPLLIQIPGGAYHSIVVTGISVSQDESTEESQVHVLDPWNGDMWLPFSQFNNQYELAGAGWENNVYSW